MNTAKKNNQDADTLLQQGNAYLSENEIQRALDAYARCLSLNPNMAEAHYNAGVAHHLSGNLAGAVQSYRTALNLRPDLPQAHFNLGHALAELSQVNAAAAAYRKALLLEPQNASAAYNLGNLLQTRGDHQSAAQYFELALRNRPDYAEAWNNLGLTHRDQNQLDQAVVCFEQALSIQPRMAQAWFNLGVALHQKNEFDRCLAHLEKAMAVNPEFAPARWHHALLLPMLYRSVKEIETARQRFRERLRKLIVNTPLETDAQRARALAGIASTTCFYLQYQGMDDSELQKDYGHFAAAVMAANYPQWSCPRGMPTLKPGNKVRLGYVSSQAYGHTIGIFLSGWIRHHDRRRFELFCYYVGPKTDALTEQVRRGVDHFHHFPGDVEAAARQIARDDLHALIHTDVGMNPLTFQLAALRLAPIQCKGWGHPVTTGLPTMDFYFSSELMEPPEGDAHYTETLVRLPNLALCHAPPGTPDSWSGRDAFGISKDSFVFLCSQSLFKYLPQHDDLYPRIARQVPNALFVFIANDNAQATAFFRNRLESRFRQFGLEATDFCLFVPKLAHLKFLNLNRCADVVLDSLEWSGGKTSMEALWCDTPVITSPGSMMRGRHTYAFLKRIGLERAIASDKEELVRIAVRCATDKAYLDDLKTGIQNRKHLLFDDDRVIKVLEAFLDGQIRSWQADRTAVAGIRASGHENNPDTWVKNHMQSGQDLLQAGQPDQAMVEFEKAVSWIPNYLGIQPWVQEYLLDGGTPPACTPVLMGELYALLGLCMGRMGRLEDSRHYAEAALRFSPGNPIAIEFMKQEKSAADREKRPDGFSGEKADSSGAVTPDYSRLSLLMVTNVTNKLRRNGHLQAPGTGLVEETFASLLDCAGQQLANAGARFLCFDRPESSDSRALKYEDNLKRFADRNGFTFIHFDHCGLQHIVRVMLDRIHTPYLLFLEHDWRFLPSPIHLDQLMERCDLDPGIHFIRFNKRPNIISNYDYLLQKEDEPSSLPLLRTVCHSNNPALIRVSTFRHQWLPICLHDPLSRAMDLRGKAFGLENPLFKAHIKDVRRLGFTRAHKTWGTYVYGSYDDPHRIVHLGE